jgi:uncharacterized protein (TIGR03435 family)
MRDASDMELLRNFCRQGAEKAFAELAHRHVALVYSAAFRHVNNTAHAEEITQAVFIILARKAGQLRADTILEGWLYETTRLTALSFLRGERRRQFREQEAYMQSTLQDSTDDALWDQLAPLLDEAMSRLGQTDRDALIQRFFKNKSVRETAASLQISEAAAQRRVLRALEKLQKFFSKRGVSSTTAILAGAISAQSVQAAPVGLTKTISVVAVAKGAAASASTLTLIKGAMKVMAWTKMKTAIAVGAGLLFATGAATVTVQQIAERHSEDSWRYLNIDSGVVARLPPQVKILPTKFNLFSADSFSQSQDKFVGIRQPVARVLEAAYNQRRARMIFSTPEPAGNFDFITTLNQGSREALQRELKNTLGLVAHPEIRDIDVLLLQLRNPNPPGIQPPVPGEYCYAHHDGNQVEIKWAHEPISKIIEFLEPNSPMPIIDQTGVTSRCHIDINWREDSQDATHQALQQVLRDQLGLELVPTNMPVDMLVVERAK